jgi:outer membrane protein TolC
MKKNGRHKSLRYLSLFLTFSVSPKAHSEERFFEIINQLSEKDVELARTRSYQQNASVDASVSYQRLLPELYLNGKSVKTWSSDSTDQTVGVGAKLNLFEGGRTVRQIQKSQAASEISDYKIQSTALAAQHRIANALIQFLRSSYEIKIEQDVIAMKETSLKVVQKQYQAGSRPAEDVEKIRIDWEMAQTKLKRLQLDYLQKIGDLNLKDAQDLDGVSWPWTEVGAGVIERLMARGQANSSSGLEIEMAKKSRDLTALEIQLARSEGLPNFDLSVDRYWARTLQENSDRQFRPDWLATLTLTVPLYQQGRVHGAVAQKSNQLMLDELTLRDAEERHGQRLRMAQQKLLSQVNALEVVRSLIRKTKDLYNKSNLAFQRGVLSANDLLDEQSRVNQYQQEDLESVALFHRHLLEYCQEIDLTPRECHRRLGEKI